MESLIKVLPIIAALILTSCKKDQTADQLVVEEQQTIEAPAVQTQDELVKNAQAKPLTTLALSEANFDFGKLKKGDHVEHIYEVTNTGKNPLIISQVKPGCGCTVPDYTKDPILPGQKGKTVSYTHLDVYKRQLYILYQLQSVKQISSPP